MKCKTYRQLRGRSVWMPGKFGAICDSGFGLMPESGCGGGRLMNEPSTFGLIAAGLYWSVGLISEIAARRSQVHGPAPRTARRGRVGWRVVRSGRGGG